jgi:hypothetical protein
MNANLVLSVIQIFIAILIFGFVLYQNRILKTEIAQQNSIIKNIDAYTKILDISKLEDYVKIREKTISSEGELAKRELEEKIKKMSDGVKFTGELAVELSTLVFVVLVKHKKDTAMSIIDKDFKSDPLKVLYQKAIVKYWEDIDKAIKSLPKDGLS